MALVRVVFLSSLVAGCLPSVEPTSLDDSDNSVDPLSGLVRSMDTRSACRDGSPVCVLVAGAQAAAGPSTDRAGVWFACRSRISAPLPSPLVGALAGRYADGEPAVLSGDAVTRYPGQGTPEDVVDALEGGSRGIRRPAGEAADPVPVAVASSALDGRRWWVAVEAVEGCASVGLFPDLEPAPSDGIARPVARNWIGRE